MTEVSSASGGFNLKLHSVAGTLDTKTPPRRQAAFSFPVPGTPHKNRAKVSGPTGRALNPSTPPRPVRSRALGGLHGRTP